MKCFPLIPPFLGQDPKYPVENLLLEERVQPWLCCPLDRSRQLRAELQLEHAGCIGYIDVGNSGSAFLQIEVGRSSWPPDRDYLTLLPTTTLMMPADAKQDRNRSGVRMFKEGDLLASALAEKWDRVRLTCSQPFHRHAQFGLAFIRIRTPEDTEESQGSPAARSPGQVGLWVGHVWGSGFPRVGPQARGLQRSLRWDPFPSRAIVSTQLCRGPLRLLARSAGNVSSHRAPSSTCGGFARKSRSIA
uniref:XRCC1 N-terminal domain containing 1, N-terminal like n=1 Tax=Naja naja TaxID=35670 RepID=A0A8C7E1W2_NAJNA